jgi:hypothetical protein
MLFYISYVSYVFYISYVFITSNLFNLSIGNIIGVPEKAVISLKIKNTSYIQV